MKDFGSAQRKRRVLARSVTKKISPISVTFIYNISLDAARRIEGFVTRQVPPPAGRPRRNLRLLAIHRVISSLRFFPRNRVEIRRVRIDRKSMWIFRPHLSRPRVRNISYYRPECFGYLNY